MLAQVLIMLVHIFCICVSTFVLVFSTNLTVILIFTVLVGLTFLQTIVFDGCILSKFENGLPIIGSLSSFLKSFTSLEVPTHTIEKLFVGLTFYGYLLKLAILGVVEISTGQSWLKFIMSQQDMPLIKLIPMF